MLPTLGSQEARLRRDYPWVKTPLVACAPMRLIALAPLAVEVSKAGGLGFIGAGSDMSAAEGYFKHARELLEASSLRGQGGTLPVGVGFLNWGADLSVALPLIREYLPAAVWFFAPRVMSDLTAWSDGVRTATQGVTKIWVQVGTVSEALEAIACCKPDVLVVQGSDAGGHGLDRSASLISLLPEVTDALADKFKGRETELPVIIAAGGIADGRGVAAALCLGAAGVVMGTSYLVATEANIAKGYRDEIMRAGDGGVSTIRTHVYDLLRGTTEWPERYGGRGVINQSYLDSVDGMDDSENKRLYQEALDSGDAGWGSGARLTTYAGTAVGLVRGEQTANLITEDVRRQTVDTLKRMTQSVSEGQ